MITSAAGGVAKANSVSVAVRDDRVKALRLLPAIHHSYLSYTQ